MFREVTMIELKEVLRLWGKGLPKKRVAAQVGLDPKTVRRYLKAATAAGLRADGDPISDERVREVLLALHPVGGRPAVRHAHQLPDRQPGKLSVKKSVQILARTDAWCGGNSVTGAEALPRVPEMSQVGRVGCGAGFEPATFGL
jgi:hypothetical protein